jgi:Dullard-like phosphatase family protein
MSIPAQPIIHNDDDSKPILALDLDHTLVLTVATKLDNQEPFFIYTDRGQKERFVYKRPHTDELLLSMSKLYKLAIFTAAVQEYGERVASMLDPEGTLFNGVFSREHCWKISNCLYVKNLNLLSNDLSRVVLLDDSLVSTAIHIDNGVLI